MQWLLREQTKHFEFALVYGSYVLMTGITMSFSGVVDTIMPRLHNSEAVIYSLILPVRLASRQKAAQRGVRFS
jgi:hypothetical protein